MHAWKFGNVGSPLCQIQILMSVQDPFVRLPDGEEWVINQRMYFHHSWAQ